MDAFDNPTAEEITRDVVRGVCRMFDALGYGTLTEFRLPLGRRVDVMALGAAGDFAIAEIKSSPADFRADRKWQEYLGFCEAFYFAVPAGFPLALLPDGCGLIVADAFGAAVRRPAPPLALDATRKRRQLLRFAHTAAARLQRLADPRV
jgi:hypothetical protein